MGTPMSSSLRIWHTKLPPIDSMNPRSRTTLPTLQRIHFSHRAEILLILVRIPQTRTQVERKTVLSRFNVV